MDEVMVVTALVTGATVALRDTAGQVVKDTYNGLKSLLVESFNLSSIGALEKAPEDETFQQTVAKEIKLTPDILSDPRVVQQVAELFKVLSDGEYETELRTVGFTTNEMVAKRNNVIEGISGFDVGADVGKMHADGDNIVKDIRRKQ